MSAPGYRLPLTRIRLDSLRLADDGGAEIASARNYSFVADPVSGLATLTWGKDNRTLSGPSGMMNLVTQESMSGHGAQLGLAVGEMGAVLRDLIECQDTLLVELLGEDGRWNTAFDGFVGASSIGEVGTSRSLSYRMDIAAEGLQRMLSQQWFNWAAEVGPEASSSFRVFGKGSEFYKAVEALQGDVEAKRLAELILKHAIGEYLSFFVRGTKAGMGATFQVGQSPAEWATPFDLLLLQAAAWYSGMNGPLMGILSSILEPDACEFFLTYRPKGGDPKAPDIPTWILRPRPWPWWALKGGDPKGDPQLEAWNALPLLKLGLAPDGQRFGPSASSIRSTKTDSTRNNVWIYALNSASDASAQDFLGGKFQCGVWKDDRSIRRYGFSMRQVSLNSYVSKGIDGDPYDTWKRIVAMNAWQDAPLPMTRQESRTYPLLVGVHPGGVVEDWTGGSPVTGYIDGVTHAIQCGSGSFNATTSLSLSRCLPATRDTYPKAVLDRVGMEMQSFSMQPSQEVRDVLEMLRKIGGLNQPGTNDAYDDRLIAHRGDVDAIPGPNDPLTRNMSWLTKSLKAVEKVLGKAVTVTSGLRSASRNAAVEGAQNSLHLKGLGFDFVTGNMDDDFKKLKASTIRYDELYLEKKNGKTWIHFGSNAPGVQAYRMSSGIVTG